MPWEAAALAVVASAGFVLAVWGGLTMPVWLTKVGVLKCDGGGIYAGNADPCCPFTEPSPSPSPPLPSPSPSASPSASPSPSPSPGVFPGAGWYCVVSFLYSTPDCSDDAVCMGAGCVYIADQSAWDGYHFGECYDSGAEISITTTDGVNHDTEAECVAAGCSCP